MALAKIVELEARLGKNSQNSSKPPSSDQPGTRPVQAKRGKRRKRGGQPGHTARFAADPVHVDHVEQYRPPACGHCCADLATGELTGSVINHWVYELPEIRPIVTDHQCLDVRCATCGLVTRGDLLAGVPTGQYGPTVQAMTGLLRGELKQSVRQTRTVMTEVLHVPMSTGMVAKTQDQVSRALAPAFQEALAHVQRDDRAHADETRWREDQEQKEEGVVVGGGDVDGDGVPRAHAPQHVGRQGVARRRLRWHPHDRPMGVLQLGRRRAPAALLEPLDPRLQVLPRRRRRGEVPR